MTRLLRALCVAFSTYSRVPVPNVPWDEDSMKYAICFFPWIGAVIGLLFCGWQALARALSLGAPLAGGVAALIPIVVSGGIHMDGFMDTCDALASHQPRERKLEILRDSHAGAFAVLGCAMILLVSAGLAGELGGGRICAAVSAGFVISRALSAIALCCFQNARSDGFLKAFSKVAEKRAVVGCAIGYIAASGAFAIAMDPLAGCLTLALNGGVFAYYRLKSYKEFGGITGDLAGWFVVLAEAASLGAGVLAQVIR